MSNTIYNAKVNDIDLKITENYVQYGSELIPTSAISFISLNKYIPRWWIPVLFLVAAAIEFVINSSNHYFTGSSYFLAMLLLIIGLITLLIAIARSRKRFLRIYSHSREHLYIEWKSGDLKPLIDAIYELLECKNKPSFESDHSNYMP